MKKIAAFFLVFSCLSMGAFALEPEQATPIDTVNQETEALAYMDLQRASPALQEEILQAREAIIFSNSWSVDGYGYVKYADGSIEALPIFSDLFPGWDVPVDPSRPATPILNPEDSPTFPEISLLADWDWYQFSEYLEAATSTMATPFTTVCTKGKQIETGVNSLTSARTCNLGYSNLTGTSLAYGENLSPGQALLYSRFSKGQYVDIRASTYSTPSWAELDVGLSYNDIVDVR